MSTLKTRDGTEIFYKEPIVRSGGGLETLRDEIHAWADLSQGDLEAALHQLRAVAERQRKVGKGEVEWPAGEMLADMLLLEGQATEALQGYQLSLQTDPNRFTALLGAARAAELLTQSELAARYYQALLENCEGANGTALKRLEHARQFVEKANTPR